MTSWSIVLVLFAATGCRQILGFGDPQLSKDAGTIDADAKADSAVDAHVAWKAAVACATTTPIPAAAAALVAGGADTITSTSPGTIGTIDGYVPALDDRILVKSETTWQQQFHGIWVVTQIGSGTVPWILTRAPDSRTAADLQDAAVMVQHGATNQGTTWHLTNPSDSLIALHVGFSGSTTSGSAQIAGVPAVVVTIASTATAAGMLYLGYFNSNTDNNLANDQVGSASGSTINLIGANANMNGTVLFVLSPVLEWVQI